MSLLPILTFPDKRLKKQALPVTAVNPEILKHLDDMLETLYTAQGIGLASTQVDIPWRLIVIDLSSEGNEPLYLINPEILSAEHEIWREEGCLSFPGVYVKVKRKETVTIRFLNRAGETEELTAGDLLGHCIQHEMDHLNGITFYDHLSPIKQSFLKKKLQKMEKFNT